MRTDDRMRVEVHTMNPGTPDEFARVFFFCHMGHDLGSVALSRLDGHRQDSECQHYEHRAA